MNIYNLLVSVNAVQWALLIAGLVVVILSIRQASLKKELKSYARLLELKSDGNSEQKLDEIAVMCQSLVGLGQHIQKIERRLGTLESSNTTGLQPDNSGKTPYRQAAAMLDMGADLNDLVNSLEMSQAEARLFQVLHGDMQDKEAVNPI